MSLWEKLSVDYQKRKRQALDDYLSLFTTSNGFTWNGKWDAFIGGMGPEFGPLQADLIEIIKVAEAYEAGFPNPEERLHGVADIILETVPSNALLFVHSDLFETTLTLRQQDGKRKDVLVLNSLRVMDQSYLNVAFSRHQSALKVSPVALNKRVFEEGLRRKQSGDAKFRSLHIEEGKVHIDGIPLLNSFSRLMMQEISDALPGRPSLFLPSLQDGRSVAGWGNLTNAGIFFVLVPNNSASGRSLLSDWQALMDRASPHGQSLQTEMAKTIAQCIQAAAEILAAQGQQEIAGKLLGSWDQRLKGVKLVSSRDIKINEKGQMVQAGPTNAPSQH